MSRNSLYRCFGGGKKKNRWKPEGHEDETNWTKMYKKKKTKTFKFIFIVRKKGFLPKEECQVLYVRSVIWLSVTYPAAQKETREKYKAKTVWNFEVQEKKKQKKTNYVLNCIDILIKVLIL